MSSIILATLIEARTVQLACPEREITWIGLPGAWKFGLEQGTLDGAFMAFVVQHGSDKQGLLQAVRELLRPGGWCAVLEWYRKETETGPPLKRRVDPKDLEVLASQAGFLLEGWRDLNGEHYSMSLRNP